MRLKVRTCPTAFGASTKEIIPSWTDTPCKEACVSFAATPCASRMKWPDASVVVENGKAVGFDLAHCKGCGICAKECPTDAIVMKVDEKE